MATPQERLIQTALNEVGYLEKASNNQLDSKTGNAGSNNYTKYARDLDNMKVYNGPKNGYAWCDVFADWCFIQTFGLENGLYITCQPKGGYGAGCRESMNYYKNAGRLFTSPQIGDQIFFKNNSGEILHTGIVVNLDASNVYTVEGNTSSASGVIANGGAVERKSYSRGYSKIAGYGRPKYEEGEEEVTQEQFNEMMNNYLIELAKQEPSDWSREGREWAEANGIVLGDDQGNKMYKKFMTREELVTVLQRALTK